MMMMMKIFLSLLVCSSFLSCGEKFLMHLIWIKILFVLLLLLLLKMDAKSAPGIFIRYQFASIYILIVVGFLQTELNLLTFFLVVYVCLLMR